MLIFILLLFFIWAFVRISGSLIASVTQLIITIITTPWLLCLTLIVGGFVLFR